MRHTLTASAALAAGSIAATAVRAQPAVPPLTAPPRPNAPAVRPFIGQTIALDPLALPFGFVSGEYERAIGRRGFAVGIGGITSLGDGSGILDRGEAYRSLQAKLKYYPREDGLRGFAVGVTAGVAYARDVASSYTYSNGQLIDYRPLEVRSRTAPTLGATLDYNWLIGRQRRFLVGIGVGARRTLGRARGNDPLEVTLPDPRLQVGFGF